MPVDPICHMTVPEDSPYRVERPGEIHRFCCEACRQKFLHPAPPPAAGYGPYTCPMHPEVVRPEPGPCPHCGMDLEPMEPTAVEDDSETRDLTRRLIVSLCFSLPLMLVSMGGMIPGFPLHQLIPPTITRWLEWILATPVVLWAGYPFLKRGLLSFVSGSLNMFTLILLGVGAAYLFSASALCFAPFFPPSLRHHGQIPLYFEAAAVILTLVLLGQMLESRARRRTRDALRSLIDLAPSQVRLLRNGEETLVPLESVIVGDRLRIRPGDKIPVDGIVREGASAIDESLLSGEPIPVDKQIGDPVTSGTLNRQGTLLIEAVRVGRETVLAQIIRMVSDAQRSRAPIQQLADRVAALFVPIVGGIAVLTFLIWAWIGPEPRLVHALLNAVAVLIIACPCALGLATPMSLMVGIGRGARAGILIKQAAALETLAGIDTLVIDKTGTLTEGRPELTDLVAAPGGHSDTLLRLAAAVEQHSEHPLAGAVLRAARAREMNLPPVADFQATPGGGVTGRVETHALLVGRRDFLAGADVRNLEILDDDAHRLQSGGATLLWVARDGLAIGLIAVSDRIKPQAQAALRDLQDAGVTLHMLTGDSLPAARRVADELGLQSLEAALPPGGKQERVTALRQSGRVVAMAGDGINDAPALAAADVGIAMGTGADVALECAGITLLKGDLRGLVRAHRLGRAVRRNIRQNLGFAFLYNAIGIPVAAGILYPAFGLLLNPMIAAAAMSFSSVSVVLNALRLRRLPLP